MSKTSEFAQIIKSVIEKETKNKIERFSAVVTSTSPLKIKRIGGSEEFEVKRLNSYTPILDDIVEVQTWGKTEKLVLGEIV